MAHGEQYSSAALPVLFELKGWVSPFPPFHGTILQLPAIHFSAVWLKSLAAPQVEPDGIDKTIWFPVVCVAISLVFKELWKIGIREDVEKASSSFSQHVAE